MKTIMITAPSSNSGKTIVTLSLLRILKNNGKDVSGFKIGPDFIDSKYLEIASKKTSGNLDIHMMGKEGLKGSLYLNKGEYALIEGAMGYFDGIFNTYKNSSFDIARKLNIPSILVYTPKGEMFSIIPKIKGMVSFSEGMIKGVILNKVNKSMYYMIKEQIEKYIGIKVLGYIPLDDRLKLKDKSLGLIDEDKLEMEKFIDRASSIVKETIDIKELLSLINNIELDKFIYPKKRNIKIAIAKDNAFNFYYNENIKILEKICEVKYFSPINDLKLPEVDLVYIGGGYPELYLKELSENISMKKSISKYIEERGFLIAEGGGLMYLMESIEGYNMLGIFKGRVYLSNKLDRFGYVNIRTSKGSLYGDKGIDIRGNEYHKSRLDIDMENIFNITKPMSKKKWSCGYEYKNILAYYQHLNFLGNLDVLNNLLDKVEKEKFKCI